MTASARRSTSARVVAGQAVGALTVADVSIDEPSANNRPSLLGRFLAVLGSGCTASQRAKAVA
jgi:hypothetical protein